MPIDNYSHCENFTMYMEVISEVEQIIYILDPTHVIFGGDFNTDLIRSSHALALRQFIDDFKMTICIDLDTPDVPYTFIVPRSTSRVGHFFTSPSMGGSVVSCNIIDNNLYSDHVPLCVCVLILILIIHFK